MSNIKNLYSGRLGGLAFLIGDLLSLGGFWLIGESRKIIPNNTFIDLVKIAVLLLLFLFMFSVIVRRLHDLGKSGWLSLLVFVPLANVIMGIILIFKPGNRESNKYGSVSRGYQYLFRDLFTLG